MPKPLYKELPNGRAINPSQMEPITGLPFFVTVMPAEAQTGDITGTV